MLAHEVQDHRLDLAWMTRPSSRAPDSGLYPRSATQRVTAGVEATDVTCSRARHLDMDGDKGPTIHATPSTGETRARW